MRDWCNPIFSSRSFASNPITMILSLYSFFEYLFYLCGFPFLGMNCHGHYTFCHLYHCFNGVYFNCTIQNSKLLVWTLTYYFDVLPMMVLSSSKIHLNKKLITVLVGHKNAWNHVEKYLTWMNKGFKFATTISNGQDL